MVVPKTWRPSPSFGVPRDATHDTTYAAGSNPPEGLELSEHFRALHVQLLVRNQAALVLPGLTRSLSSPPTDLTVAVTSFCQLLFKHEATWNCMEAHGITLMSDHHYISLYLKSLYCRCIVIYSDIWWSLWLSLYIQHVILSTSADYQKNWLTSGVLIQSLPQDPKLTRPTQSLHGFGHFILVHLAGLGFKTRSKCC